MTEQEHLDEIEAKAVGLAEALTAAVDAGVSQAIIMPKLVAVLQKSGLLPGGVPGF